MQYLLQCILQITANQNLELNETFWMEYIEAASNTRADIDTKEFHERLISTLLSVLDQRCRISIQSNHLNGKLRLYCYTCVAH